MLLEAKEQVSGGQWSTWVKKNFGIERMQAWRYMRLAERPASRIVHETSLTAGIGERTSDAARRIGSFRPIQEFIKHVDVEAVAQERQARADEQQLSTASLQFS